MIKLRLYSLLIIIASFFVPEFSAALLSGAVGQLNAGDTMMGVRNELPVGSSRFNSSHFKGIQQIKIPQRTSAFGKRNFAIKAEISGKNRGPMENEDKNNDNNNNNILFNLAKHIGPSVGKLKKKIGMRLSSIVNPLFGKDKIPLGILMGIAHQRVTDKFDCIHLEEIIYDLLMITMKVRDGVMSINGNGELVEDKAKLAELSDSDFVDIPPEDVMKLGIVLNDLLFDIIPKVNETESKDGQVKMEVVYPNGGKAKYEGELMKKDGEIRKEAKRLAQELEWDVNFSGSNAPRKYDYANAVLPKWNLVEKAFIALGTHENGRQHANGLIRLIILTEAMLKGEINEYGLFAYLIHKCRLTFDSPLHTLHFIPKMEWLVNKYWPEEEQFHYKEDIVRMKKPDADGKAKDIENCEKFGVTRRKTLK